MYFTYTVHYAIIGVKYPHGYVEFQDTYEQNFFGYVHVFEVQLFSGVVDVPLYLK